ASPDVTTTYQPIVDAIRAGVNVIAEGDLDDVWLGVVASAIPELSHLHPDAVPPLENLRSAERLREGFARALETIARHRPTLVIVEDIHWSDVDTIDALGHLARRLRSAPMLLVLTHRSEEVPLEHPLRALRRSLLGENRAFMRSLGPLNADEVAQLAAVALRGATPDIGASVARASGGNPLFALQMLHHFAEAGDV